MANTSLNNAKINKNDEFYTTFSEIEHEISNYINKFKNKKVFCNCDDFFKSNFVKYFLINFKKLHLKELIVTGYKIQYVFRITNKNLDNSLDLSNIDKFINKVAKDVRSKLRDGKEEPYPYNVGDFRDSECIKLLEESDVIVTNPPFSLFREYISLLIQYKKQFIILGSMNAVIYKEFFPLLKNNKVWLGYRAGTKEYIVPELYAKENPNKAYKQNDKWYSKLGNTCWFTNIDHKKRHEIFPIDSNNTYYKNKHKYVRYDNYDAINVNKMSEIPCDYEPCWYRCPHSSDCEYAKTNGKSSSTCKQKCNGIMGVPITFIEKYCPEQFEILGITLGNTVNYEMTKLYINAIQHNKDNSIQNGAKINTRATIYTDKQPANKVYYTADNSDGFLISVYPRILIRRVK